MKTLAKKIIRTMVNCIPLSAYQLLVRRTAIVLFYHVVSDKSLNHIRHLYSYKSSKMFEADLIYLKQNYNLLSYKQFTEHLSSQSKIRPNSILLTFDDGLSECFSIARPFLLKHKIPCIFFVTADFIDNKNMFYRHKVSLCIEKIKGLENSRLTAVFNKINTAFRQRIQDSASFIQWLKSLSFSEVDIINEICAILSIDIEQYLTTHKPYLTSNEIRVLVSEGFTIGAHGKGHPEFNLLSNEEIEEEIVNSCRIIMNLTGERHIPFAFPFSGNSIDRYFLENITSKYKFIGLLFDRKGLRKDEDFIINRIQSDLPSFSSGNKSNIPRILRYAYAKELGKRMKLGYYE